jgi:hypothetical protein
MWVVLLPRERARPSPPPPPAPVVEGIKLSDEITVRVARDGEPVTVLRPHSVLIDDQPTFTGLAASPDAPVVTITLGGGRARIACTPAP